MNKGIKVGSIIELEILPNVFVHLLVLSIYKIKPDNNRIDSRYQYVCVNLMNQKQEILEIYKYNCGKTEYYIDFFKKCIHLKIL
jgi:hypothetical protein